MLAFVLRRLFVAVPTVLAIMVTMFVLLQTLPGDPVQGLVGEYPAPPEYVEQIRHQFGLDQPVLVQLGRYVANLLSGDLGYSFAYQQPVTDLILQRALNSLLLLVPALVLSALLGTALGAVAATRRGTAVDHTITTVTMVGFAVPAFWLAQILILVFGVGLGWFPVLGMRSLGSTADGIDDVLDVAAHWLLPGIAVSLYYLGMVARISRQSILESSAEDYILTAWSIGLPRRRILVRHILRNALIPVATVVGYNFGYAVTGAILVEAVFSWPGIGSLFVTSIQNRDYPVLEGVFLLTAVSVVVANLVTDVTYALIDPRVKAGDRIAAGK
ncbi:ABC transporter permease [Pseudonocardia sp. GCM10023141]|uniref:ABC transporter permease n=1 Tax=Pseudonocardia sp. GCM10023141 TaxID=3252653 RepID=UPI00361501A2